MKERVLSTIALAIFAVIVGAYAAAASSSRDLRAARRHCHDLDMTKRMHVIIIGTDFTTFMHEHAVYSPNGHFGINQAFPKPGTYYVHFDGRPTGLEQQVFRFKIEAGGR